MILKLSRSAAAWFPVFLLAFLVLPSAAPGQGTQTPPTPQLIASGPQVLDVQGGKIRVVPVALGLYHPWSLAFPDARTILVTEKNGRLRMIRDGVLQPEPIWTSPTPIDKNP